MDKKIELKITGMSCAGCSSSIEKRLNATGGIKKAVVNLPLAAASVQFDDGVTDGKSIIKEIKALGFGAEYASENSFDEEEKRKAREFSTLRLKLIASAVFAIPLFYIAMFPMLWSDSPLPDFINMETNFLNYALAQLFLAIPVMLVGYKFFTRGYFNLFKGHPNMDSLIAIGTSAAFIYSTINIFLEIGGHHTGHGLYFESTAVIITLVLLGKTLEAYSKNKTGSAIK
ncbi:MAG: cation transporter, partial [Oscillospiraceae bacterium]